MRHRVPLLLAVAGLALAACSSGGVPAATTSGPEVVDGITVPPVYVTPPGTVVPGPSSCPTDLAHTLRAVADYQLRSSIVAHLVTCTYALHGAALPPACTRAVVIVDTQPQAFKAFDRWEVETGQNSMWTSRQSLRPTPIAGIGTLAEWVPALLELGAGNNTTWVTVRLRCPSGVADPLTLARKLAVEGLASSG